MSFNPFLNDKSLNVIESTFVSPTLVFYMVVNDTMGHFTWQMSAFTEIVDLEPK